MLAVIACTALSAQPGFAAHRGKLSPHTDAAKGSAPAGPAASPEVKTGTDTADHDATHPDATSRGRTKGPDADQAGKGSVPGRTPSIDLVRPDDGYINLRRRAARASLVAGKKQLEIGRPAIAPHLPPAVGAGEATRTATGVTVPANPAFEKHDDVLHPPATVPSGVPRNSLGLAATEARRPDLPVAPHVPTAVVTGINGTTMNHTTPSSIGGAAKDRSAISGSSYHHH
jgi:hypothetical protein